MFLKLAGDFSWNTMSYLAERPSVLFVDQLYGSSSLDRLSWFYMGISAWQDQKNRKREAITFNNLSCSYNELGNRHEALKCLEQAQTLNQEINDFELALLILGNLATTYEYMGDLGKAEAQLRTGLMIITAVEVSNKKSFNPRMARQKAILLNSMAGVYLKNGDLRRALDRFLQVASFAKKVGNKRMEAESLINVGATYHQLGDTNQALNSYLNVMPTIQQLGLSTGEGLILNGIGAIYHDLDNDEKALDYYRRALPIRRQSNDRAGEATTLYNMANSLNALGERARALECMEQALPIFSLVENRQGEARTLYGIGIIHDQMGDKDKALEYYLRALPLMQEISSVDEIEARHNVSRIYAEQNNLDTAIKEIDRAIELDKQFEQSSDKHKELSDYLKYLKASGRSYSPKQRSALPQESIDMLIEPVVSVLTGNENHINIGKLKGGMIGMREEMLLEGAVWTIEIEFIDALLALLDGNSPELAEGHPYKPHLQRAFDEVNSGQINSRAVSQQTLPKENIDYFVTFTVAALTYNKHTITSWKTKLNSIQKDMLTEGTHWKIEIEFIDALLAMLDGSSPELPESHPYRPHLQRVLDRVENYDSDNTSKKGATGVSPDTLQALVKIYELQGEGGLRAALQQADLPEEAVNVLITMIQSASTSSTAVPDGTNKTLPQKTVEEFCDYTFGVKTVLPNKLSEWLSNLHHIRTDFAERGNDWANEVTLVDALISITNDETPFIPPENPYATALLALQDLINAYHNNESDES